MHWLNENTLAPLFEVNERLVELTVREQARGAPRFVDAAGRRRIARCPCLLVDAGLREPESWFVERPAMEPYFARDDSISLAQMTLVFAWSMARMNPNTAGLVLGISPRSASFIAGVGLRDLARVAHERWWAIRPRWMDRPEVWQRLAQPEGRLSGSVFGGVGLRALQLLFWELVQNTAV